MLGVDIMRIYELFDTLTRFEFNLRYYKGKEYLALDESLTIEELKISDFKLHNFYLTQDFIDNKLSEILDLLKYFNEFLIINLKEVDGEYYHRDLFKLLFKEFCDKGANVHLDPLLDGSTKILYHLSNDIKNDIERKIDIIQSIQNSYDYNFKPSEFTTIYVLNDVWKRDLMQSKIGEITTFDWEILKRNKYHELSQTDDYKKFFTKEGLLQFEILKEKINEKWRKDKFAMFIKVLDIKGYFKEDLTVELMMRFATLLTKKTYNIKDFDEAVRYKEKWLEVYGGFEILTVG